MSERPGARRHGRTVRARVAFLRVMAPLCGVAIGATPGAVRAQASRLWRPDDRALLTDFSYVTAIAASQDMVFAATPTALVVYDRLSLQWRETAVPPLNFPGGGVVSMVADPLDDTAWLAAGAQWFEYRPLTHEWQSGLLPGGAAAVVLDSDNPTSGAWFDTGAGWVQVGPGGFVGVPGTPPAPGHRIAPLGIADLRRVAPAYPTALARIATDADLRSYQLTGAAMAPVDQQIYLATDGNGAFRLDPVGYAVEQLPSGLLAPGAGGMTVAHGRVCVGTDVLGAAGALVGASGRRGVTCVSDDLSEITPLESNPRDAAVGPFVRDVAIDERGGVWAASDAGVVRLGRGRAVRLTSAEGLPSSDARVLAADSGGVWVGTSAGLAFVDDADRPTVEGATQFGAAVGALAVSRDTLWVGSALGLLALPRGARQPVPAVGGPALRLPVVDLAVRGDTIVLLAETRVLWRTGGVWSDVGAGTPNVGRFVAVAMDGDGVWVAGTNGVAWLAPRAGTWVTMTSPDDVPQPVFDIAAAGRWVWVATAHGLVRYDKRALER